MRRLLLVVVVAIAIAACSKRAGPTPGSAAARIVSLSPSTTEAMFAIGAGPELVGRSRYCDWPPEARALPQVGGYVDPNFEAILALRPDLVTGARGPAGSVVADRLAARDVATYFPETESFAAIEAMLLGLGERTGHAHGARAAVDAFRRRIEAIEEAARREPKRSVLLVFGLAPLVVAGPGSFADEMIRRAGGRNVVPKGGAYPTLDLERVLSLDPDVIVNAAMAAERSRERIGSDAPGWARARAVAQGRVVSISDETVMRPGPRVADGLATLARAIHPDARIP